MKPAWDELGDNFINSKTTIIGDVDCTVEESLCAKYGVKGYPTIKYFTDATGEDGELYEGGRDINSLLAFAEESLAPSCSHANMQFCDEEQTATLETYLAMTAAERKKIVDDADKAAADIMEKFEEDAAKLNARYAEMKVEKEAFKNSVNTKELKLLKSIRGGELLGRQR